MENASKALIMAAGVLIGIMVLTLAVYLFATFGATSADVNRQQEANRLNQFNTQFTSYEGKECTIYDIISVVNLANDNNRNYELTSSDTNSYYITVNITGAGATYGLETKDLDQITETYLKGNNGELAKYTCTVHINDITERVDRVDFKKNN